MPLTGIRIRGARSLNRSLTTSIRKVPKEMRRRIRKAGNIVRDEMRRRDTVRSGRLKKSRGVKVRTRRSLLGGGVQLVAMTAVATVGSVRRLRDEPGGKLKDVFWDRFQELGVRPHRVGKGSNLSSGKQSGRLHPGHPPAGGGRGIVGPSVEATEAEVFRQIGQVFKVI